MKETMADNFEKPWSGVETAGNMALSFVNTLDWRLREAPVELLHDYVDLLRWAWTTGALSRDDARALRIRAEAHPRVAVHRLQEAKDLREVMARLFGSSLAGKRLPATDLDRLDRACRGARTSQALRSSAGRVIWDWRDKTLAPDRPLQTVALNAAELLTSDEIARVRQCGDAECGWFFLDTSKNKSRRWCSMESCGNRNKARSFYRRSTGKSADQ